APAIQLASRVSEAARGVRTVGSESMTAGGRRNLRAAVEEWLQGPESHPTLRLAFEEFLAGRYAGLAPQLRQVHAARRRFLWDDRRIRDVYGVGGIGESHTLSQAAHASAPVDQGRLLFQRSEERRVGKDGRAGRG